jgi:3-isopropylmalate/(R)-2-methylmalate dehydratase small subunit
MKLSNLRGRVAYIFDEEDFDVDQIVGIENIKILDNEELARVSMKQYDPEFASRVRPGDLLVGGGNFGYGHPHYPAMKLMRHWGVTGVVADSFAPFYWRHEMNMAFPQVACPGIRGIVGRWDDIEVDWARGVVVNHTRQQQLEFEPFARSDLEILAVGGFIPWLKKEVAST